MTPDSEATRPAGTPRTYLVVPDLTDATGSLVTAFAVSQEKATTILAQPDLSLSLAATLPEDQALLRSHVSRFRGADDLAGGITASLESVSTISETVGDLLTELLPTARRLDAAAGVRDDDLASFREALSALRTRSAALDPDSHGAALPVLRARDSLTAYARGDLTDDLTRFTAARRAVNAADVLARVEEQVDDLQSRIDRLNREVADGAVSQILPAISFGFEIAQAASSAESNVGELVLGVGFAIKDMVDEGTGFAAEMRRKNQELDELIGDYRDLVVQLAGDEQEMAVLVTIGGHAQGYARAVAAAATAAGQVLEGLAAFAAGIDDLALLDSAPDGAPGLSFFTDQVTAAVAAWQVVGETCARQLELARTLGGPGTPAG